jgi:hypothetical protein
MEGESISTQSLTTSTRDLAETDFTLSAFRLPEPYGVDWERSTPWSLILAGTAFGLVVLLILGY